MKRVKLALGGAGSLGLILLLVATGFPQQFPRGFPPNDYQLAEMTHRQAAGLMMEGKYREALPLQKRALEAFEGFQRRNIGTLGKTQSYVARGNFNLGTIYNELGEYSKALPFAQKALQLDEELMGKENPTTALAIVQLAESYRGVGSCDKALPLYQRALRIFEKAQAQGNALTAFVLRGMALCYKNLGDYDKALSFAQRSLQMMEKTLGKTHKETVACQKIVTELQKSE